MCAIHRRFCELLPDELLWVEHPRTGGRLPVIPGAFRRHDVRVARHVPVNPRALPRFLQHFEAVYSRTGRTDAILTAACAHHRLLWIHPFVDGNGRVARMMSHAILLDQLDSGAIWSASRGLARHEREYREKLIACDRQRRNDLDGRGNLSEEALADFAEFFLRVCLDQVEFMEALVQPDRLRARLLLWAEEEIRRDALPPRADQILEALLYRGELPRGDVAGLLGVSDRHARRITASLIEHGIVSSPSTRAPLRLAFPAHLASRLMPGLFPERVDR
ncbi:Fic family protein [Arhodomonas sp. SL1]|uniref:Fic family protein n=1 Tax=Arhodomonas sp. SL1 TaxID=3425691 RepID=UPI003F883ED4